MIQYEYIASPWGREFKSRYRFFFLLKQLKKLIETIEY